MKVNQTGVYEDENIKIEYSCVTDSSIFFFADKGGLVKLKFTIENKAEARLDVDAIDIASNGSPLPKGEERELIHGLGGKKTAIKIFYFDSYVEELSFNIRYELAELDIKHVCPERYLFSIDLLDNKEESIYN